MGHEATKLHKEEDTKSSFKWVFTSLQASNRDMLTRVGILEVKAIKKKLQGFLRFF